MSNCYVGIASCGHIRLAVVDSPEHRTDTAKTVMGAIKDGLSIERVSADDVRSGNWGTCDVCRPAKRKAPKRGRTA
jgi:hypothetical protein